MLKTLLLPLLLICLVQIAQASQQEDKSLDLVLSMEKLNYYVAEPISISALLYNKQEVTTNVSIVSKIIYYRKIGYDFVPYKTFASLYGAYKSTNFTELKPNENMGQQEAILYNIHTKQFVLEEPGIYEFKVSVAVKIFESGRQIYTSNVKQITVSEPPDKDKLALKALKKYQLGDFLNGLDPYTSEGVEEPVEKAALFIEKYRDSLYTPLVSRQLKANLNDLKKRNDGELPPELETIYIRVKALIESESPEDEQ